MNKKIVHSVFESIAEKFPDKTAVEEQDRSITYSLLNRQANRIAHKLLNSGLQRQAVVGIFLPAGIDYISAILGVSKAGGIFLPLDIEFPEKRLSHILSKTTPTFFITNSRLKNEVIEKIEKYYISSSEREIAIIEDIIDFSEENPPLIPEPDDGNYIIFTSGSTGEPKAILGCHKSLSHFIHWEMGEFQLDDSVRISQFAPTTFDVSFRDMFVPLLSGGTVCIPTKETGSNIKHLLQWMENSKLTMVHCVPSLFRLLMKEIESSENPRNALPTLKRFLLAGEALYGSDVIRWMEMMGDRIELVNIYGPSETTLAKAFHRIKEKPAEKNMIMPVGQPISNTALLLLKDNALCRIGEIGEIYIKTPFRSKGYFNDPEATQKSFVQNPLTPDSEDIIYKTGDMGKYLSDRSVAFIGRLDRQVKVSGIRIELDEIESVLRNCEAIDQNVIMAYKTPEHEHRLVCYYTLRINSEAVEPAQIRAWLGEYLPSYMIPSFFVKLNQFRLNIHGKIDRKALPKPEALMYEKIQYEAPANEIEAQIAAIWKEVLSLDSVGVNNPFFEIGGNSLSAIRILSRIYKTFGTEISIKEFFEHATVRKLAKRIEMSQKSAFEEIPALPEKSCYDLSQAQRRLWILDQMEGGGIAYNIPSAYRIDGNPDISAFEKSFDCLIQRHESLRTGFIAENGEPMQQILSSLPFRMEIIDLSQESSPETAFKAYADKELSTPFDLSCAPLLMVKLFRLSDELHILLLNIHHIISDAWSLDVLAKDVLSFYEALSENKEINLLPLRIHYKDYAAWQNRLLASDAMKAHQAYWHHKLAGELPVLNLPADFPRPPVQTFNGSLIRCQFEDTISDNLIAFGKEQDASLFMSLLSVLKILLYRYSGQEDIIIGSPIAGRNHPDLENQIGFYINMLPLRDEIFGTDSFGDVLKKVRKTTTEAYDHQIYPFDRLVDELNLARDVSHSPIFDVGMTFHTDEKIEQRISGKIRISEYDSMWKTSKYDLVFIFVQSGSRLRADINFNTDLYSEETVRRMGKHLEELIRSILQNSDQPIRDSNILSEPEKQQILISFNDTQAEYPKDKNIVEMFKAWVEKTPDQMAVIFEDTQLTYAELNARSDAAAAYLSNFIQPKEIVGVMMERSEKLIVSLLGILKAGCAYLPIDPAYPKERIDYILQDSRCGYVLTEAEYVEIMQSAKCNVQNEKYSSLPTSLAYIIYTSGSTGKPKGAMIEHQGPINMSLDQIRSFGITSDDHILQFSSQSFDASLYEIFMALFSGATIVIANRERAADPESFTEYLNEKGVTVVTLPPVYLSTLNRDALRTVKTIITAGEPAVVSDALYYSRHKQYINAYGPSEASVCVSFHRVDPNRTYQGGIPIGKPISNTQIFILDESLQPVPIGVPGEICVSGDGLGRGYLNRPDLTDEKFISNPFYPEKRMYKTGDIGKWLPDGNIEFIGRKDDQVKIRGYRIELGEIESALKRHTDIAETLVIAKKGSGTDKELAAYFTTESNFNDWSAQNLRIFLAKQLPEYMIPAHFVRLEKFPVTPNGKIDRKALPEPEAAGLEAGTAYVSPSGEMETILAEIWESVLGKKAGMSDNYFALGGDSIKAIQIVSRLRQKNLNLEVIDIFRYPTIAQLSEKITVLSRIIDQRPVSGHVPLTAIQEWFFKTFEGDYNHFNQAVILRSGERLNEDALIAALRAIQTHHDALRMRYRISEDRIVQENVLPDEYPFEFESVNPKSPEEMNSYASEVHRRMDLGKGPLMKAVLFRLNDGDRLLVVIHHLIVDMVSWRILIEDIKTAYRQALSGQSVKLPEKTDSFKQWAEKIKSYSDSEKLQEEKAYWLAAQSDSCPKLPQDFKASDNQIKDSSIIIRRLSPQDTQELLGSVGDTMTINDILLVALARALKVSPLERGRGVSWHGVNKIRIMMEGHGREALFEDLNISRTVGWFTSIYPITLELPDTSDIGEQIRHIRELLKKIPSNGIGYAILKYVKHALPDVSPPQISFNYLGQFDDASEKSLFRISDESTGDAVGPTTKRFHDIEIRGMVVQGQLELSLTFNTGQYKAQTMETLLDNYVFELKEVVSHCTSKTGGEIIPSDLTYQGLSSDDLDKIFDN
jgi:amino acid adenylation domain-containing protein/non-ribosomal peptide synthase protein (TIGR01720 family)